MIKQTITYEDFNGNEVTEDFYFHLTKLEIMEMEISFEGGLSEYVDKLTKTDDSKKVYYLFKDIILKSYGKKNEDGRQFEKSDAIRAEFEQSPALGELIFGFLSEGGGETAAQFIQGLLPSKVMTEVQKEVAKKNEANVVELPTAPPVLSNDATLENRTVPERDIDSYSRQELLDMPQERFDHLAGKDPSKMDRDLLVVAMQRKSRQ